MFKKSTAARRCFKLALIASIAAIASVPSFAANTTTASATATVMVPIAVTKFADLSFGTFAAAGGGSVTISTSGARTSSGVFESGGSPGAARFDVTGEASATYSIDTTTGTSTQLSNGGNNMALTLVSDTTAAGAITGTATAGTLDGTGKQSVYVGGVLTVGATQAAGSYSGTVSITVAYN